MTVSLVRRCAVYYLPHAAGPWAHVRQWGYIGKALNPEARWRRHVAESWWWPYINGRPTVHWYASEAAALEVERQAIETLGTLFNDRHNQWNPHRVLPPARVQARRGPSSSGCTARLVPSRPVRVRRWSRRRVKASLLGALWLVLFAAILWVTNDQMPLGNSALAGAVTASVVVGRVAWPKRTRRRRRRR